MRLPYRLADAIRHLRSVDPKLASVIRTGAPCDLQRDQPIDLFAWLLKSIIGQQLHVKVAAIIHARVCAVIGEPVSAASCAQISDVELRAAGLSAAKLIAIRDLTERCLEGTVPTARQIARLSDDALIQRLTAIRGVGAWTVHMILIFRLGRPDVMPVGDFAIRQAFDRLYSHPAVRAKPAEILTQTEAWRPFRSVGAWYLWESLRPPRVP